jgi:hypothetical protein
LSRRGRQRAAGRVYQRRFGIAYPLANDAPGLLQLRHGSGEILDHKADHRAGGEVLVVLIAGAEHLELVTGGQVEDGEVWPWWTRVSPSTAVRKSTMAL